MDAVNSQVSIDICSYLSSVQKAHEYDIIDFVWKQKWFSTLPLFFIEKMVRQALEDLTKNCLVMSELEYYRLVTPKELVKLHDKATK